MQIVGQTWPSIVTLTCEIWSAGQHDLYSWSSDFAIYLEDYLMYVHHTLGLWISITWDLKINVGHCDLYFIVQWFCLVSWRLFDIWTSLFGIMNQYDPTFDLKINVGHCDLYFMVQWFCVTSWRLFSVLWDYGSVWPKVWPQNKYRSMWPIFHGPVIFALGLKGDLMDECHIFR